MKPRFAAREAAKGRRISAETQQSQLATSSSPRQGEGFPTYWYSTVRNFGDSLAPLVIDFAAATSAYHLVPPESRGKLLTIGSNHHWIRPYDTVAGAGSMYPVRFQPASSARIISLRGPLTWELLGRPDIVGFGDPGLLASQLALELPAEREQECNYGNAFALVPHVSEVDYYKSLKLNFSVIDPRDDPVAVCAQIAQFEFIISSSLHGIVVADSFGIPSVWVERCVKKAGLHKFLDYFLSVGRSKRLRPQAFPVSMARLAKKSLPAAKFSFSDVESTLKLAVREHVNRNKSDVR